MSKEFICLICLKDMKTSRSLGSHMRSHGISIEEYKNKFNLHRKCKVCKKMISKNSKSGYCGVCRPRSGKNNPFYGKTHTPEVIESLKKTSKNASKKLWKDPVYRKRVIDGATGLKRSEEFKATQKINTINQMKDKHQRDLRSECMKESWQTGKINPLSKNFSQNRSKNEKEIYDYCKVSFSENISISRETIKIQDKWFMPDIIINDNIIIEYYGDYWHGNPKKYKKDDIIERTKQKVGDIWGKDADRKKILEDNGFHFLIIWEKDYKENKTLCLEKLTKTIKELI